MGSVIFAIILIALIIVFALPLNKEGKIIWSSQLVLDFTLIYLIACVVNMSKTSTSVFLDIVVEKDESGEINSISVKFSRYIHIFINLLTIITFFIQLTSANSIFKDLTFSQVAQKYWWVYICVYLINTIFLYTFFAITSYLLNQHEQFKEEYKTFYLENSKKVKEKSSEQNPEV